jgi:hypothetical protein
VATADLTLVIEHASGETSELVVPSPTAIDDERVTLSTISVERALDRVGRCEAAVFRDEWLDVLDLVDRRDDELYVEDDTGTAIFGGRLDDWQFDGTTVSVQIDSWERDALDDEPPVEFSRSAAADDVIASDILDLMPASIATGVVEQTTSSIDYGATHTSAATMLRELADSTGAEVRYHPDGTVDYLDRRGAARDDVVSPSAGAVIEEPRIRQTLREEVTDVRAISDDDPTIYEEATAIATDAGERQVWEVDWIDSTSSSRLQARATRLANEYADAPEYLEVETALDVDQFDPRPAVGDSYPVQLPAYGIDERLRVIETTRSIDDEGDTVDVLLSNRKLTLAGR